MSKKKSVLSTRNLVTIAILGVMAFVLMMFQVPLLFIAPGFMQLDFSDVPTLIGGFAMGPLAGVLIALLKNVLHIVLGQSTTVGIGELSNFIISATFSVTASLVYRHQKTQKNAVKGLILGVITMTLVATLSNYFVIFPMYSAVLPMDKIVEMGHAIFPVIDSLFKMMIFSIVPFNLIKGSLVSLAAFLLYKPLSPIIKGRR